MTLRTPGFLLWGGLSKASMSSTASDRSSSFGPCGLGVIPPKGAHGGSPKIFFIPRMEFACGWY